MLPSAGTPIIRCQGPNLSTESAIVEFEGEDEDEDENEYENENDDCPQTPPAFPLSPHFAGRAACSRCRF
jgi:hypothetical protein